MKEHVFGGAEVEKAPEEPAAKSFAAGLHFGNGPKSFGESPHEDDSEAINRSLHVNEGRTNRERMTEESAKQPRPPLPTPAQQHAAWVDQKVHENFGRYLERQKKTEAAEAQVRPKQSKP